MNGKDRRLPLRTLQDLSFPERKDPFDVKMLSLRNLHNTRTGHGRESCHNGYSYFLVRDENNPAGKDFNHASVIYNKLLVRQGFLMEKGRMLKRTSHYLKHSGLHDNRLNSLIEQASTEVEHSEKLLQDAYQAYAHAFIDNLNIDVLDQIFSPAAGKLESVISNAENLLKNIMENLPKEYMPKNAENISCPSPVPEISPDWKNGQWRRNGKPCFYYYPGSTIPPQIAEVLGFLPNTFQLGTGRMPLENGEFINVPYCREQFNKLSHNRPESNFYFNTRCGLHFCEFESPRWWLEKYSQEDPDILFFDADGQGPLKSTKHKNILKFFAKKKKSKRSGYASLNFWNENVRRMLESKFDAFSRANKKYFKDNFPFYILGWEAGNYGPGQIETGHNLSAKKAFRAFLKNEYKTIDNLNKKWTTNHKTFAEINPPKKPVAPCGVQYEFQRFRQHGYREWVDICRRAIQENTPHTPVVFDTQKSMFGPRKNGFDIPTYFEMTDIAAFHTYWESNRRVNDRLLDSARKAYGKTIGNNEWTAVMCCPEMFMEDALKNNGIQAAFHRMMWGQGMSTIWYSATSNDWMDTAPTAEPRLGTLPLRYHSTYIPILMDRSRRFGRVALQAPSVQPDVAMLESASSYFNALPAGIMRKSMENIAIALEKRGYNYGFLFEQALLDKKQSLRGIQTIIVVNGTCLQGKLSKQLGTWIKNGGTLVCLAPIGVYNRYGQPDGRLLQKAFPGVTWKHDNFFNWIPEGGNIPGPVKTLTNCKVYTADLGKGRLYVFSRTDTDKDIQNFTADIVAKNTKRSFYSKDYKFDLCLRELGGKYFLYVLNPSLYNTAEDEIIIKGKINGLSDRGLERPLLIPFHYKEHEGQTIFKMNLSPAEGTLLEFER